MYQVVYKSGCNEVICYFNHLHEITETFGLNSNEIASYYTSINVPKFESVVISIKRVEGEEQLNKAIKTVVFD
jgi:hypothetical protein